MKEFLNKNNQKAVDGTKMVEPFSTANGFLNLKKVEAKKNEK